MTRAVHLTRRFVTSLRPGRPPARERAWVDEVLAPQEAEVWQRLSAADQRHSAAVARRVERALSTTPHAGDTRWLAAALLHDVGKLDAGLGTFGRVAATLAGAAAGREMAGPWSERRGFTRRAGLYLQHPEHGQTRLELVGARAEAAQWAGAHHDEAKIRALDFPPEVVTALQEADDD